MHFKKLDDGYEIRPKIALPFPFVLIPFLFVCVGGFMFLSLLVALIDSFGEGEVEGPVWFAVAFIVVWESLAVYIFHKTVLFSLLSPGIRIDSEGVRTLPRLPFLRTKQYRWYEIHDYGFFLRDQPVQTNPYRYRGGITVYSNQNLLLLYFSPDRETALDRSGFHTVGKRAIRMSFSAGVVPDAITEEILPFCERHLQFPPRQQ